MKTIKTALAAFCLTATSAYAATFNFSSTGTISSPVVGSPVPIGAAYSLDLSFDPVDRILNDDEPEYSNVSGTLNIAGAGAMAISSARRTGFGSNGLGVIFEGTGLSFPEIFGVRVQFADAVSPIGRSHVEFFRNISNDEISFITVSESNSRGGSSTYLLDTTSVSFGEVMAPAPVPLPATGAMLVGALGLLGWRGCRKRDVRKVAMT